MSLPPQAPITKEGTKIPEGTYKDTQWATRTNCSSQLIIGRILLQFGLPRSTSLMLMNEDFKKPNFVSIKKLDQLFFAMI